MEHSFLQTKDWEQFLNTYGTQVKREAGLLFIQSKIPAGTAWSTYRCNLDQFSEIPQVFRQATYLRFEPETADSLAHLQELCKKEHIALKQTLSVQPHQSLLLDLSSDEELLAGMKSKHRYNVHLAERKEVEVQVHTKYDESLFERFWNLLSSTSNRQEFSKFPKEYYRLQWQTLTEEVKIHLAIATHEGEDLAALFLLTYQDAAIYLHGGSSEKKRDFMAPHLLQFKSMGFARGVGCKTYDFWGTDAVYKENEWMAQVGKASAGTTRFKLGFGGHIIEYPGTWDLILKPFWYSLYNTARQFKGRKRAFK